MVNKIKNILANNDYRSLIENFFSLSLLSAVGALLPFVVLPYVVKTLGFSTYGLIVLVTTFFTYFASIVQYGFNLGGTREIAVNRENSEKVNQIYCEIISTKIFLLVVCSLLILISIFVFSDFSKHYYLFLMYLPFLWTEGLYPTWLYQGVEKMKFIALINTAVRLCFVVLVFFFIKEEQDYYLYILFQSLISFLAFLLSIIVIRKQFKIKFKFTSANQVYNKLKQNFSLGINGFVPTLFNHTTKLFLGIFISKEALGLYDFVSKIITIQNVLLTLLSRTFFPLINRKEEKFPLFRNIVLIVFIPFVSLCFVFRKNIFSFLNIPLNDLTEKILLILSIGIVGISFNVIYNAYLLIKRKDKLILKNSLIISCLGFVLAYPLVKYKGLYGAAINIAISQVLLGCLSVFYYLKIKKNELCEKK